jgi:gluconolactonase
MPVRRSSFFALATCLILLACAGSKGSQPPATGGAGGQTAGGNGGLAGGGSGGAGGLGGSAGQGGAGGVAAGGSGGAGSGGLGGAGGDQPDARVPMDASQGGAGGDASTSYAERICGEGASYGEPLPPEGMRTAAPVMGGFGFIEGPVWLEAQGVLLFSDMDFGANPAPNGPPSRVRRFTPPSGFDVLVENGNTNGLAVQLDGQVIGCAHDVQSLVLIDPVSSQRTPLGVTYVDAKKFNSPNDLTIRSDGTVYFTDPDWQLGPRTSETGMMGVYRVPPGGGVAELITSALDKPNGIALSPDERTLYVGSYGADIWKHAVNADGSVEPGAIFASPGASDGLGIDCAGNVYVTSGSVVRVFSASGMPRGDINVAENPSNVAFGGADHKTLFITAGKGLYSIVLNVPGLPY